MTTEECNRCKYAPRGGVSTCGGDDLPVWTCDKIDDPRMPFDMKDDTPCPCFEPDYEVYCEIDGLTVRWD